MVHHSKSPDSADGYTHKGVETATIDLSMWKQLTEAGSDEEFCHSWLGIQAHMVGGVYGSVVVLSLSEKEALLLLHSGLWDSGIESVLL